MNGSRRIAERGEWRRLGPVFVALLLVAWCAHLQENPEPEGTVSFDEDGARRVFPGLDVVPLTDGATRAWAKAAVERALARYPKVGLARRLDRVYVVDRLSYEGRGMSGTNDEIGRIVLMTDAPGIDASWVEQSVHHEFAHILQSRAGASFPTKDWEAANAPGFRYGDGGFAAVARGQTDLAYGSAFAAQGVLSQYGASSLGEDWATFAEGVLNGGAEFWSLVRRFPRLRAKAGLAAAFYRRAFPGIRLRNVPQ